MSAIGREDRILLEHGSGGALSRELVEEIIYPYFSTDRYPELSDASPFTLDGPGAFTTDTFVVDPLFFPGGDIGRLAVFGTCNDLSVSGARPAFLSMGIVLEEGLPVAVLRLVLESVRRAADEAGASVVTGDTKVVPRGKGGGIYVNTAGIGRMVYPGKLGPSRICHGDKVILSAPPGAHGITILAVREKLAVGGTLSSDCANLFPLCEALFTLGGELRFIRDATRGGVAAVANEAVQGGPAGILVRERDIPTDEDVEAVARILGLNTLEVANEGVLVAVVSAGAADRALELLRRFPIGSEAAVIGEVVADHPGKVVLETPIGGRRLLDFPRGLLLPRIC